MPTNDTRRMSFRPVAKMNFPIQVSRRIMSIMVYMVNPYTHDG